MLWTDDTDYRWWWWWRIQTTRGQRSQMLQRTDIQTERRDATTHRVWTERLTEWPQMCYRCYRYTGQRIHTQTPQGDTAERRMKDIHTHRHKATDTNIQTTDRGYTAIYTQIQDKHTQTRWIQMYTAQTQTEDRGIQTTQTEL